MTRPVGSTVSSTAPALFIPGPAEKNRSVQFVSDTATTLASTSSASSLHAKIQYPKMSDPPSSGTVQDSSFVSGQWHQL